MLSNNSRIFSRLDISFSIGFLSLTYFEISSMFLVCKVSKKTSASSFLTPNSCKTVETSSNWDLSINGINCFCLSFVILRTSNIEDKISRLPIFSFISFKPTFFKRL